METNTGLDEFRRGIETTEYQSRRRYRHWAEYRRVERMGKVIGVK